MLSGEYPFQDDDEYSELQNDQSNNQSSETEMMSVKNETDNDDIDDDTDDETDPSQIKRVKKKNDNKNNVGIERKKRRRIAVRKKQRLNLKKQKKNLAERIRDFDFDRDGAPILRNIWKINSQSNNTKFKEDSLSEDAFDLVKKLLSTNPSQRPSAEDALQHRWFDPIKLIMNEIEEKHQQKQIINHLSNTSKKSQNKTQQQFIITLQEKKLMRKGSRVAMEIPDISPTSSSQSTTFSFQNILNENNQAEEDGAIAVDDILIAYPILIPSLGQNSDSDWLRSRLHLQ
ncbi:MAG: hypothetical protein EZS28_000164 [Streblomastix strix]|uniref:Protein kinase domain-containing protein n=1 Tax=Streblomastix strix TaxID=222440 RepID=A0A5J4XBK0_9EUKA|nr:MAG: hypothetical protein EZS28_000164 [Streblomastix strix]